MTSKAYFTGVINASGMIGLPAIALAYLKHAGISGKRAQARRAGPVASRNVSSGKPWKMARESLKMRWESLLRIIID